MIYFLLLRDLMNFYKMKKENFLERKGYNHFLLITYLMILSTTNHILMKFYKKTSGSLKKGFSMIKF